MKKNKNLWKDIEALFGFLIKDFRFRITRTSEGRMERFEYVTLEDDELQIEFIREMGKIGIMVSSVKKSKFRFSLDLIKHLINREEYWCITNLESHASFLKDKLNEIKYLFREQNIQKSNDELMKLSREEIRWFYKIK